MAEIITLETNKRFHVSKWIGVACHPATMDGNTGELLPCRWCIGFWRLAAQMDEEDDYKEPDEGGGTKKHRLKAPRGGVNKDRKNLKKPAKVCKQSAKKAPAVKAKNRAKL
ncbi:hypothetical protein DFH07DRAFT_772782 [Mycena maculata]|uniref:Uncharacterized protein n=1 Tax=Mycena maculata TaxID=230809 RepID=A0AAD7J7J6_9AGAR|nr:hypothetical protein DFH07DRAFT_772782 [Mycena maculata]